MATEEKGATEAEGQQPETVKLGNSYCMLTYHTKGGLTTHRPGEHAAELPEPKKGVKKDG